MAEKRINDESRRIATSAYLKPDNYVLIDGVDGSAKAPLTLFGSVRFGGALTDAASVTVPNNALSTLTTAQSALTLNVNSSTYEVPNFAVEITTNAAVTITVTKTLFDDETNEVISTTTLKSSAAGGNEMDSGKTYQLTCVGTCWTVAEFVDPTAQQSTPVLTGGLQSQGGNDTLSINDNPLAGGGTLSLQTTDLTGGELGSEETEATQATAEGESA